MIGELECDGVVLRKDLRAAGVAARTIDRLVGPDNFLRADGNGAYRLAGAPRTGITAIRSALGATTGLAICLNSAMSWEGISLRWLPTDPSHVNVLVDASAGNLSTAWYSVHPTRRFDVEREATYRSAVRATTVPRTIRDFAATLPRTPGGERQLDAWIDEARVQRKLEVWQLGEAADAERSRKVRKRLKALEARHTGVTPAEFKSIGEEWLRDLIQRLGLPEPLWNTKPPFATKEVDAYYPLVPLIIEFDGYWAHRPRGKHHRDRAGDRRTLMHGVPTVRITKWDFDHDLAQLEADLVRLITGSSAKLRIAG